MYFVFFKSANVSFVVDCLPQLKEVKTSINVINIFISVLAAPCCQHGIYIIITRVDYSHTCANFQSINYAFITSLAFPCNRNCIILCHIVSSLRFVLLRSHLNFILDLQRRQVPRCVQNFRSLGPILFVHCLTQISPHCEFATLCLASLALDLQT